MPPLIILVLFLLAVAFFLQVDFIFYIAYICLGIYAFNRWFTPRSLKNVYVKRNFTSYAFWGERVQVQLEIENRNRLPISWLEFSEDVAPELHREAQLKQVVGLRGNQKRTFGYSIRARKRGYYRLGPMLLRTGDVYGLVAEQRGFHAGDYLTVYPRIIPLTRLGLPSRLPFGTIASKQRLFEDPARPMGVRDYRSGDSLRQINWKVSAHTRDLVVKTFQPAISLETAILLNLNLPEYERSGFTIVSEWGIELAASLAAHLINQRQPVGLFTNGADPLHLADGSDAPQFDEITGRLIYKKGADGGLLGAQGYMPSPIPPRNGRSHLIKILEQLARLEIDNTQPFVDWLPRATVPLTWGVTLLVITPRATVELTNALHRLVRQGYNPILLLIEPDNSFPQTRERARRLGFTTFLVPYQSDLDQWRRPVGNIST